LNVSFRNFEGKIIRKIEIQTIDPFAFSLADSSILRKDFLSRTGNYLHIKSKNITIRNLLIIHQNKSFDSLLMKESIRLIRSCGFVHDVKFSVEMTSEYSDSVDVKIRISDNWSIFPRLTISNSKIKLQVSDRNFAGLGQDYSNTIALNSEIGKCAYKTKYYIQNIKNSYISASFLYETDEYNNYLKYIALDRRFFSTQTKWAGGLNFSIQYRKDSVLKNSILIPLLYKLNRQDYWLGYSRQLLKGNTENSRSASIISSIRYMNIHFLEKPTVHADSFRIYTNEDFCFVGIGISIRKYIQDRFVFRYDVTEDVPIGKIFSMTLGMQNKNEIRRLYLGFRASVGNYYNWGYLSFHCEYGTFYKLYHQEQGVLIFDINYFTKIKDIGNWKFRLFIKQKFTQGFNRFEYDSLTLNDGFGIDGFSSSQLSGIHRVIYAFQVQSYAPFNLWGFRFGPYANFSFGMIGHEDDGIFSGKIYSQFGLGVLIKNENLVFGTFQFSIAFYPNIPGLNKGVFKFNSFKSNDFGFSDYELKKPSNCIFQ